MTSTKIFVGTLVIFLMTGCSTTPLLGGTVPSPSKQSNPIPPFPELTLTDHPSDPLGFCLDRRSAADLGVYIKQLQAAQEQ